MFRAMRFISVSGAVLTATALLAACGGGGGSMPAGTPPGNQSPTGPQSSGRSIGITFTGTQTLAKIRQTRDLNNVPVTVSVNGAVVGTGTLDGNGHAKITFTVPVAAGATVTVVAGSLTVTATLAMSTTATAILVIVNGDGTVTVKSAADMHGDGNVDNDDPEQDNDTEDGHGGFSAITANGTVLPANAPFSLTDNCTSLTITPVGSQVASVKFEEKTSDGEDDDNGRERFEGPFTGPLTFPIIAGQARLEVQVFDAKGQSLIDVKAPLNAFTSGASASPCPSPSASASATPSPTPAASASPGASPSPTATPTPEASETPEPASPTPTATPTPTTR
jgi:hypothetical protein